jgi:hypothetical protein
MPEVTAMVCGGPHTTIGAVSGLLVRSSIDDPTVIVLPDAAQLQRILIGQQLSAIQYAFHNSRLVTLSSGQRVRLHQK